MNRKADIIEELKALESPLAAYPGQMPFAVPEKYFQDLGERLATGVRDAYGREPQTAFLPQELPFQTPEGYFEGLSKSLTDAATAVENSFEKDLPFQAPTGYFDTLPQRLLAAALADQASHSKTIRFTQPWRKWAVAAAASLALLCLSLGAYRYYDARTPEAIASRQLAQLNPDSLTDYVAQHADEFDHSALEPLITSNTLPNSLQLPPLDPQDIRQYLEESGDLNPAEQGPTENL